MSNGVALLLFSLFFALCAAVAFAGDSPAQQETTAWWCVIMRCPLIPLIPPWNISPQQPPWFQPPLPPFVEPIPVPLTQPPPPPRSRHHSRNRRHPPPLPRPRHHSGNRRHPPSLPRLRTATRNRKHTRNQCRLHRPQSPPPPPITIEPSPSPLVQHNPLPSSSPFNLKPPLPPSPPLGTNELPIPPPIWINRPSDCSTALVKVDGCVRDLIQSFFGKQMLIGRDCCKVISCFDKAFTEFNDPIFRGKARAFCSPHL